VGPHFFYGPYHVLIAQVKGPGMAQDVLCIHEAWATCFVMTVHDGLMQVGDCLLLVAPLSFFDHRSDAARLRNVKLHL
jgi:hypothetical protein